VELADENLNGVTSRGGAKHLSTSAIDFLTNDRRRRHRMTALDGLDENGD
jgi:hypothetical protein